ncbi:MAG: glycoside hydrolase N-terminal domain-containing protein [Candidatus Saccharicenans sp.]|nr:glycoside hydrolase N-terminal domain-containing protein [Candidatus Saccharicenans sp.]
MKSKYRPVLILIAGFFFIFITISDTLSNHESPEVFASPGSTRAASDNPQVPERGFISTEPGETWELGLLSGNGTIGANVLSQPLDETIIFTHERLFLPGGTPHMPPDNSARLFEIRRLIERGLYRQAQQLAFDLSGQSGFMYPDPFVPAFEMNIKMDGIKKISDYLRSVNFQTGEASVQWNDDAGTYQRKLFVSRADGIAVLLITGPGKRSINCRLKLKPVEPSKKLDPRQLETSARIFEAHVSDIRTAAENNILTWENSFTKAYPGSIHKLEGMAYVAVENGTTNHTGDTLTVSGADQVLVFVDLEVLYDATHSKIKDMKDFLANLPADYETLLNRHLKIHGELFNRMRLDLGGGQDHNLPTEELLARSTYDNPDRALIEKEFDAGRYNIISSIGELPPTLQGIWAGTYNPPWASDFTHNGNVPSAIASLLMGNTPELMLAYTSYLEYIVPYLEINAKHMFGARGIVLPSRSTTHGFNNALNPNFAGGFWVAGAAWAAHFFYDYYLHTGDREFLAKHALPFMEKAALFFEDYLYEGPDGKYIFSPTQSPENFPANTRVQASYNATMDVAAAKELLNNLIAASRELRVNKEKIPLWKRMLEKMPDYMIDEKLGVVKEWLTPRLEEDLNHRHSSQLYALYDGLPEEIASNPELRAAFKRIIEIKLNKHWKEGTGFMSFGVVQLGQAAASLEDGELAYECLKHLVNRYWLNNLASMHNHKSLFNMDISGGLPAVIIRMLVASEPGRIKLLPALPAAWPSGAIEGVLCRGQIEIKRLDWNGDRILINLVSAKKQSVTLETRGEISDLAVKKGKVSIKKTRQKNSRLVSLPAGNEVTLEIKLRLA